MPLKLGSTDGYDNIYYTYVLREIRAFLLNSSNFGGIYISPTYQPNMAQSIRLWGNSVETQETWRDKYTKSYDVDVCMYMTTKNITEGFYKIFYEESERIYQLMHDNKKSTNTTLAYYAGEVSEIVFNEYEDEETEIDGLFKASFNFNCLVDRVTTASINI